MAETDGRCEGGEGTARENRAHGVYKAGLRREARAGGGGAGAEPPRRGKDRKGYAVSGSGTGAGRTGQQEW